MLQKGAMYALSPVCLEADPLGSYLLRNYYTWLCVIVARYVSDEYNKQLSKFSVLSFLLEFIFICLPYKMKNWCGIYFVGLATYTACVLFNP